MLALRQPNQRIVAGTARETQRTKHIFIRRHSRRRCRVAQIALSNARTVPYRRYRSARSLYPVHRWIYRGTAATTARNGGWSFHVSDRTALGFIPTHSQTMPTPEISSRYQATCLFNNYHRSNRSNVHCTMYTFRFQYRLRFGVFKWFGPFRLGEVNICENVSNL